MALLQWLDHKNLTNGNDSVWKIKKNGAHKLGSKHVVFLV